MATRCWSREPVRTSAFFDVVVSEVSEDVLRLGREHLAALRRYYPGLVAGHAHNAFRRYNWVRRTAPLVRLLRELPRRDTPWRILDAGCGMGTESICWAVLRDDVEVLAVDISADRLRVAEARKAAWEQRLGRVLAIRFACVDVFAVLHEMQFDIVWAMESVSHIDPAERFLGVVGETLSPGGHLVISDSNAWNPVMAWRVRKLRRQGVTERGSKSLGSGEKVPYAHERLFSVPQLTKMLCSAGLSIADSQVSAFFPPALARLARLSRALCSIDEVLNRVPLVRYLGGIYAVVAVKRS